MLRDATVLVTGGTGFLGSHLTRRLAAAGCRVCLATRPESSLDRIRDVSPPPQLVHIDLDRQDSLDACVRAVRPDVVFHLAGLTAARRSIGQGGDSDLGLARSFEVNLMGALRVFQAVASHAPAARVIRTGTVAEYGVGPAPSREDQRGEPASPYGASQLAATHLGEALFRQLGLAVTTARLALTYGPAQSETFFIPALIRACLDGRPFEMTQGNQTRDYLFVDDVIDALVQAAVAPDLGGQVLNVGSGHEYRIADVAALIVSLTGGTAELRKGRLPDGTDPTRLVCEPSRGQRLLDWHARTPIEAGLEKTIAWYRNAKAS